MKLWIVLAAHNEEKILENSIRRIIVYCADRRLRASIIIAENGSSDRTTEIAQKISEEPSVTKVYLARARNAGLGYGLECGIQKTLQLVPERDDSENWVLLTASDLPFGFTDLERFIEENKKNPSNRQWMIGSKSHPESKIAKSLKRTAMSVGFAALRRWMLGSRVKDSQGTYFIRLDLLRSRIDRLTERGFAYTAELCHILEMDGVECTEVPVSLQAESRPTTVRALRSARQMFLSLVRLYFRLGAPAQTVPVLGFGLLLAAALGVYGSAFGLSRIWPTHTGWIESYVGDLNAHQMAWVFYRNADWSLPFTYFNTWLFPVGTVTVSTDSIPIAAAIAKLLRGFLPEKFQYFGLWHFSCFVLIGLFGRRVLRRMGVSEGMSLLGGAFVMLSAPLLEREGHVALCSQWLILWAFDVVAARALKAYTFERQLAVSCGIIFLSLGTHPYLWAMLVPILWSGFVVDTKAKVVIVVSTTLALSVLWMWALGFFWFSERLGDGGFGWFHADLTSLINPRRYSHFFEPAWTEGPGDYEGSAYLGAGGLLLVLISIISILRTPLGNSKETRKLIIAATCSVVFLFVFSMGSVIAVNGNAFMKLGFYRIFEPIPSALRSSGRFIWPLYYFLVIGAWACVAFRFSRRIAWTIGLVLFVLQAIESKYVFPIGEHATSKPGFSWNEGVFPPSPRFRYFTPADLETLDAWSPKFNALLFYQDAQLLGGSQAWLDWAAANRKSIQLGSASRLPTQRIEKAARHVMSSILNGRLEPGMAYILPTGRRVLGAECSELSIAVICKRAGL